MQEVSPGNFAEVYMFANPRLWLGQATIKGRKNRRYVLGNA